MENFNIMPGLLSNILNTPSTSNQANYGLVHQQFFTPTPPISLNGTCKNLLPSLIFNSNDTNLIKTGIEKCRGSLNARFSSIKLSPTHLAAIRGDNSTLTALYNAGAKIDLSDALGFTPLHHMAMKGDVAGVMTFLNYGANPKQRNNLGGTYADLLRFNEPYRKQTEPPLNPTFFSAHRNDHLDVDSDCISDGVTYVDENVAHPKELIAIWEKMLFKKNSEIFETDYQSNKPLLNERKAAYTSFKEHPPKLKIKPIKYDDTGKELGIGYSFCGLVAEEPIPKGAVIAEYVGEIVADETYVFEDSTYLWADWPAVDSTKFRSAASMANHGFPNAMMNPYAYTEKKGIDGLPFRKLLTAMNDIDKGTEITIDYGSIYDWKYPVKELRGTALRKFIINNKWQNLFSAIKIIQSPSSTYKKIVEAETKITQFSYILQSSSTLINLVQEGLMNARDIKLVEMNFANTPFASIYGPSLEAAKDALAKLSKASNMKKEL